MYTFLSKARKQIINKTYFYVKILIIKPIYPIGNYNTNKVYSLINLLENT